MKWAGEETLDHDKTGNLRRAPTPFPKEMRAMAKKVLHMKEKRALEEERNNKRRTNREFRQRGVGKSVGVDEYDKVHKHGVMTADHDVVDADRAAADKVSRDSGVISPSDTALNDSDNDDHLDNDETITNNNLMVHDTPTVVSNNANNNNYLAPVKAEIVTNDVELCY